MSDFLVNSVDVSLQENGSDTYDRPTKRKYIDKHGNVTWMETAKINDATGESQIEEQEQAKLAEAQEHARTAERRMWDAYIKLSDEREVYSVSKSDFIKAACEAHPDWDEKEFPDIMTLNVPQIWEGRFDLIRRELTEKADWVVALIPEPIDTPSEVPEEQPEETVKDLWAQVNPAISAWKEEREGVGHASKTMFVHAALRYEGFPSDTKTTPDVLKTLLGMLTYGSDFKVLETLIRKQLDGKSLWAEFEDDDDLEDSDPEETSENENYPLQDALDEMKAKSPNMTDREDSKLLKQKKQALKSIWDKRIQAAADYVGDGDTDLNQYLSLQDLEKGFAEYEEHDYCADAFRSAFQRTSETSFNIVVEKTLESGVSLEVLKEEARAIDTYAYDVLQWQKQEWIQQLIEKKKAKETASAEQAPIAEVSAAEDAPDMNALWDAFNKRYPKWKAKYAESGYKENDLIQASTEAELLDALRVYRESDRTGMPSADEVIDMTDLIKQQSYPFAKCLRDLLRAKAPEPEETLPLQNALDEMKVDTETFDWNAVRPDFDPDKHEWLQVVIQRGTNHTTVSKIPTGPAHFTYGTPETEVVVEKGLFPQEKLRGILAELSEIFAKWVADQSE